MNLLDKSVQGFINQNLNTSVTDLLLKKSPNSDWDMKVIVEQIQAKNKAKSKLPAWFAKENIIYKSLALEQCPSEITGQFKAKLIKGEKLAGLTGGFGVDSYFSV